MTTHPTEPARSAREANRLERAFEAWHRKESGYWARRHIERAAFKAGAAFALAQAQKGSK